MVRDHVIGFARKYKGHLVTWALFILYEISLVSALNGRFNSFWDYFGHYALHISLFYCHACLVLPLAKKKKAALWLVPLLVVCEIATYAALTYLLELWLTQYMQVVLTRPLTSDFHYWLRAIWRAVYFIGFATGYFFLRNYLQELKRAEEAAKQHLLHIIEKQKLQHELVRSQNAFLKAQINPHFLFNTLNYVYNSVRKTSSEAAEAIMSLSQMMRYALQNENELQESDLLEEIEHLEHLINIHQIRHNNRLQVNLSYGDNLVGVRFIPLVLITLAENIFKHGDLTKEEDAAQVKINLENGVLCITTRNLRNQNHAEGHGIGLDNLQRRLAHAYGERASFTAYATPDGHFITETRVTAPNNIAPAAHITQAAVII